MPDARRLSQPDAQDIAKWHDAALYGIALQLRKEVVPERDVPQCFRDLVGALENRSMRDGSV